MIEPTLDELESKFSEHNIPRRRLYPWWYRVCRKTGIKLKPPVLFTASEHFIYGGSIVAIIIITGSTISRFLLGIPYETHAPLLILVLIVPGIAWLMYRGIRRKLGLEMNPQR